MLGFVAVLAVVGLVGWAWWDSRLPDTYNVMDFGSHDYGGGPVHGGHEHGSVSVASLKGPQDGAPDATFELTTGQGTIKLPSGRTIDALTFNGTSTAA